MSVTPSSTPQQRSSPPAKARTNLCNNLWASYSVTPDPDVTLTSTRFQTLIRVDAALDPSQTFFPTYAMRTLWTRWCQCRPGRPPVPRTTPGSRVQSLAYRRPRLTFLRLGPPPLPNSNASASRAQQVRKQNWCKAEWQMKTGKSKSMKKMWSTHDAGKELERVMPMKNAKMKPRWNTLCSWTGNKVECRPASYGWRTRRPLPATGSVHANAGHHVSAT